MLIKIIISIINCTYTSYISSGYRQGRTKDTNVLRGAENNIDIIVEY